MRLTVLGSGSKGNCLIIDTGNARIAVDAGFGTRTLTRRFKTANIAPDSIDACVITHEHQDHACGALKVRDKWKWHLLATAPTLDAIDADTNAPRATAVAHRAPYAIGDVRITLLPISHDAASPSAVLIEDMKSGARAGVAYDLGEIPEGLPEAFSHLDMAVLEANHDMTMLRNGPYPFVLQERVAGRRGHLSNVQAGHFAARIAHRELRVLVLAHLSQENNTHDIARAALTRALRPTRFRGTLITAKQDSGCGIGVRKGPQLALF
jgi:phosphoribosyl 1,2-cyclic phosphodiesterase